MIFSKQEKIVTYLKFAKIQRPLRSERIKNTTVEFTFGRSFSALQRRTSSFFCFTCSSDVPLQITRGLMAFLLNERDQNNSGANALQILIFFEGPRCHYQWRHHISPGLFGISVSNFPAFRRAQSRKAYRRRKAVPSEILVKNITPTVKSALLFLFSVFTYCWLDPLLGSCPSFL